MVGGGKQVFLCNAERSRQLPTSNSLSCKEDPPLSIVFLADSAEYWNRIICEVPVVIGHAEHPRAGGIPSVAYASCSSVHNDNRAGLS